MSIEDNQRRVLGMVRALADIDTQRTAATQAWQSLAPADEAEARALLDAALVLLLQVASDPRLGGRAHVLDTLTRITLKAEATQ